MKLKRIILSAIFAALVVTGVALSEYFPDIIVTSPNGVWTDTRAYATLGEAINAIGLNNRDMYIVREEIFTTLTIPSNISLHFRGIGALNNSGQLSIQTTSINAPNRQIFNGVGEIDFARGTLLHSRWFADLHTAFDQTVDNYVTLAITNGWGANIDADCVVGDNVTLKWYGPGNTMTINTGFTLSNINDIDAGDYQVFAGSGDFDFVDGVRLNLRWFNRLRSATTWIEDELAVIVVPGVNIVDYDQIMTANEMLDFNSRAGVFSINAGVTLTIYSPENVIANDRRQIFTGTGTVSWTHCGRVSAGLFGFSVDASAADNTAALEETYDSFSRHAAIYLPGGEYDIDETEFEITDVHSLKLYTDQYEGVILTLSKTGTMFTAWSAGGASRHGFGMENLYLYTAYTPVVLLEINSLGNYFIHKNRFEGPTPYNAGSACIKMVTDNAGVIYGLINFNRFYRSEYGIWVEDGGNYHVNEPILLHNSFGQLGHCIFDDAQTGGKNSTGWTLVGNSCEGTDHVGIVVRGEGWVGLGNRHERGATAWDVADGTLTSHYAWLLDTDSSGAHIVDGRFFDTPTFGDQIWSNTNRYLYHQNGNTINQGVVRVTSPGAGSIPYNVYAAAGQTANLMSYYNEAADNTFAVNEYGNPKTPPATDVSVAGVLTIDMKDGVFHYVLMTENITSVVINNAENGNWLVLHIKQPFGGAWTLPAAANWVDDSGPDAVKFVAATAPAAPASNRWLKIAFDYRDDWFARSAGVEVY